MMQPDVCDNRNVRSRITVRFAEPLMNAPTGDVEADAHRLTFAIYECLKRHIRAFPEQWAYWRVLEGRMIPGVVLQPDRRNDSAVWSAAYGQALAWASRSLPTLRDPGFRYRSADSVVDAVSLP